METSATRTTGRVPSPSRSRLLFVLLVIVSTTVEVSAFFPANRLIVRGKRFIQNRRPKFRRIKMAPDEKPKIGAPPIRGREPSFDETKSPLDEVETGDQLHEKKKTTKPKKPQPDLLTGFRDAFLGLFPSYKSPDEIRKGEAIKKEKNLPLESNIGDTASINGANGVSEESRSIAPDAAKIDVTTTAAPASSVQATAEKPKDVTIPKLDESEQNETQNVVPDSLKPAPVAKDELKDVSDGDFVNKVATADSSGRGVIKAPKVPDLSSFPSEKKTSQESDANSPSSKQATKKIDDNRSLADDILPDAITEQGVDEDMAVPEMLDDDAARYTELDTPPIVAEIVETSVDDIETEDIASATRTVLESYSQKAKETSSDSKADTANSLLAQDTDVEAEGEKSIVDDSAMSGAQLEDQPSKTSRKSDLQSTEEPDDDESISHDVLLDAIKIAQQGVEGRIADLDMTGLDEEASSETDTPPIVEIVDTAVDEVDMEAIAAAARTAVESYTQKMKETPTEAKAYVSSDLPAQDADVEMSAKEAAESEKMCDFSTMRVSELKEELGKIGLSKQGKKVDLVARLETYRETNFDSASTVENAPTEDQAPKKEADERSYSSMKVAELRKTLSKHGLNTRGKKTELIARLENADSRNRLFEETVPQHLWKEPTTLDYSSMSVVLLKEELMKRDLPRSGRKAALIARLEESDSNAVSESETLLPSNGEFLPTVVANSAEEPSDQFVIDPLVLEDAADAARNAVEALDSFEDDSFDLDLGDIESSVEAARESVELFESTNNNIPANGVAIESASDLPLSSSEATPAEEPGDQIAIDPQVMKDAAEAARNAVEALESFEDDNLDLDLGDIESVAEAALGSVELFESTNNNIPANGVAIENPKPDMNEFTDWSKFSVKSLRKELASRGLSTAGSKIELIASLETDDLQHMLVEEPELTTESRTAPFLDDIDLEDFDLAAIDEKAREAIMTFEAEDEPSDEALWEIENEMDMEEDFEIPEDILNIGTEPVPTPPPDYESLPVAQLKAELKNRGLRVTGKKVDLIARLQESD